MYKAFSFLRIYIKLVVKIKIISNHCKIYWSVHKDTADEIMYLLRSIKESSQQQKIC
jgi:hypothetical protein